MMQTALEIVRARVGLEDVTISEEHPWPEIKTKYGTLKLEHMSSLKSIGITSVYFGMPAKDLDGTYDMCAIYIDMNRMALTIRFRDSYRSGYAEFADININKSLTRHEVAQIFERALERFEYAFKLVMKWSHRRVSARVGLERETLIYDWDNPPKIIHTNFGDFKYEYNAGRATIVYSAKRYDLKLYIDRDGEVSIYVFNEEGRYDEIESFNETGVNKFDRNGWKYIDKTTVLDFINKTIAKHKLGKYFK